MWLQTRLSIQKEIIILFKSVNFFFQTFACLSFFVVSKEDYRFLDSDLFERLIPKMRK